MTYLSVITSQGQSRVKDKRAFERLPWKLPFETSRGSDFAIKDFSPGGIGISSKTPIGQKDLINFSIKSVRPVVSPTLTYEVIWSRKDDLTGEYLGGARFTGGNGFRGSFTKYLHSALKDNVNNLSFDSTPWQLAYDKEEGRRIVQKVETIQLPPFLQSLVQESRLFSNRSNYGWKWCYEAMHCTTLSSVDSSCLTLLGNTKFPGFMLSILLDDLADGRKESKLLEECENMIFLGLPLNLKKVPSFEKAQGAFISHLWEMIQVNMRQFPRHEYFKDLIQYDFERILDTFKYARLSNKFSNAINEEEAFIHEGNNINVMIDAMMDVMCSPGFDAEELGRLRQITWHAQMMCKIANWIATWKREVATGDWTSGIIALALQHGVISCDDLLKEKQAIIVRNIESSSLEEDLMWRWERYRRSVVESADTVKSVDVKSYLKGVERFFQMQVVSRGLQ